MSDDIPMPWLVSLPEKRFASLEYEETTMYEQLKRRAEQNPEKPFLIFPKGKILNYKIIVDQIEKMAAHLQHLGIQKGDRVALLLPNTPHYVIGHFAVLLIGGIVVQANPLYTEHELVNQMTDSGAKAIISLTMFQDKVNRVMEKTDLEFAVYGQIQTYLGGLLKFLGKLLKKEIFDPNNNKYDAPIKNYPNTYFFDDFIVNEYEIKSVEIDFGEDIAILQYTGGTTGVSKGAMLTNRNLSINTQQARSIIHMVPDNEGALLAVLPMFHIFGLTACLYTSIRLNIPMVLNVASPPNFTDILKWIPKYGISFFPAVPAMLTMINNHKDVHTTDFSSLKTIISGGAALPLEVANTFEKLTGAQVCEAYGLSETSPLALGSSPELPNVEGSIGFPAPDTLAKIVDQSDYTKLKPIGEAGEICIKGPQVMKGYWNRPEETSHALPGDGWFRTGDVARFDENGYGYIVDRIKDLIIVSGFNVVPNEVEDILYKHPAVMEAAVAGLPHEKKGEMVAAWVVLKDGKTASEEEILAHCQEYLAPYKIPKKVTFRDELPKSMVGKILRKQLREEH
ncbi:MAG: long-chain fatty acid--CoA ligase [Candidatus Heimdallarchaeota archaeon]|nr:long-chain fatty acid--CoA ligase [Candidatus Heimdallarchaeota archaeon]